MPLLQNKYLLKTIMFSLFLTMFFNLSAQKTKEQLQKEKQQIEKDIRYTNKLLNETKRSQQTSTNQIVLIKKKIEQQEKLINTISYEVNAIDRDILENEKTIKHLDEQLIKLKNEYAKMIYYAYKNRRNYDRLMFVLSSDNFNQAYRRIRYFQQYSQYRQRQAVLIVETQEDIHKRNEDLLFLKNQKQELLNTQQHEKTKLAKEQEGKSKVLNDLKSKEQDLVRTLRQKEQANREIQAAIQRIIQEEIRKAEEKRRAEAAKAKAQGKESTSTSKPATTFALTPEETQLSTNFASNKGKLPWPVEKGVISVPYGDNKHPVLPGVVTTNNGIDIATTQGATARVVFEGVVLNVITLPLGTKGIIVKHGEYLSVYANLSNVSVKAGDKVKTKQNIGTVYTNTNEGKTEIHFELWKNQTKQNPTHWIAK